MTATTERGYGAATVPVLDAGSAAAAATRLAADFAEGALERDRDRRLPRAELEALSASGLLAITVPRAYGGAGLPVSVAADVLRLLGTTDPSIAQIPQSHFVFLAALDAVGGAALKTLLYDAVLGGARIGNAQAETGTKHARDIRTTLTADGDGWILNGTKGYSTGALLADWIPVLARLGVDGPLHVAWVPWDAPGLTIVDDWDGMGQRTTASGTVRLESVRVARDQVMPQHLMFDRPQVYGAYAQLLHSAIDAGIARGALQEAARLVRTVSRPAADAQVALAIDDPLVLQQLGELEVQVRSAEALLAEGARTIERADIRPGGADEQTAAAASLAVATARVVTSRAAVEAASRLFEVAGTRSAAGKLGLDRHWRNARTHTLHDPVSWKVQHLGRYAADGTLPPNHSQI